MLIAKWNCDEWNDLEVVYESVYRYLYIISDFCKSTICNETILFEKCGVSDRRYNALLWFMSMVYLLS